MVKAHSIETALTMVALVGIVIFIILHLLIQPTSELWWILAVSTLFIAISDVVMRLKK